MSREANGLRWSLRAAASLLLLAPSFAPAQVLAHPGWTRAHAAGEPWYKRAIFYQLPDATPDFKALSERLDAMQSTGIDAIIVTPPALPSLSGASAEQAIAAQSALDAFDNFTRQATARGIRVLATLPATHGDADLAARARFWLTRGVAGLRLEIPAGVNSQDRAAIAASVRSLAASIPGQRIVLVNGEEAAPQQPATPRKASAHRAATSPTSSQLQIITLTGPLTAAALRPQISRALAASDALLDTNAHSAEAAPLTQVLVTLGLTTNPAALTDPAKPLILPATQPPPEPEDDSVKPPPAPIPQQPPAGVYLPYVPYVPPARPQKKAAPAPPAPADPFTVWIAKLAALHHSNQALRTGTKILLDFDAQNVLVWVARPASATPQNPPVVVLCNLSPQPVELSLADAIKKLNLHGFFLRTLLRSDSALGGQDLEAVKLPPYGVFIGEVRR
jgi:hypothetical protein